MDTIYLTIIAVLVLAVLVLSLACRRLVYMANNRGMQEYAFELQKELRTSNNLLWEHDAVFRQLGELLDHAGVDLEKSEHKQVSTDLKVMGHILRSVQSDGMPFDIGWANSSLCELGDRYGIEPVGGRPYTIRELVKMAERAFESVLQTRTASLQH